MLALTVGWAGPARAQKRHHISLGFGYTKLLSSDLKDSGIGIDFTNAAEAMLAYRYSFTPSLDVTIDSRATVSTSDVAGVSLTLTNNYVGPGIRWNAKPSSHRLFAQGNVYYVSEQADAEANGVKVSASESSGGFGLSAGLDFRLTQLLSLPVEAYYLYGKPSDDVSGVGGQVSIAWNFGADR
jgi:hypothetical protein